MTTLEISNLKHKKMEAAGDRLIEPNVLHPGNVAIIREVYDTELAHKLFAMQLERALDANCAVIIIEPNELGDETARWIAVGNCLQKTAVISGLGAMISGFRKYDHQKNPCNITSVSVCMVDFSQMAAHSIPVIRHPYQPIV